MIRRPLLMEFHTYFLSARHIFVREIEEEIFLKFKAKAVVQKKMLGEVFNEARALRAREELKEKFGIKRR